MSAQDPTATVKWYRRLDVRLLVMLVVALLGFGYFSDPVEDWVLKLLGYRVDDEDVFMSIVWFLAMTGIAVLTAAVISRRVTRRLARMHAVASRPVPSGRLPGPFDESGGDEVARLASTMNSMHLRVNQLLDDIARQEMNRRDWLAQVSHDLRTPLTALVACLDRAELALQSPRPETLYQEVPDMLAVAKLDIDRVQSLANDLFEIARLEARDALNLEPVPPGELVRQTVKSLEPFAAKKGVKLEVRLPGQLPILSADGRRLMRSLENLLRNAIQHAEAYVWVRVDRGAEGVRFEVRDDGVGFPGQEGTLSFDELRSRRSREDSAGLGLSVTEKVAEAHGGTVGAYNSKEGGAVVWFALPDPDTSEGPETRRQAGAGRVHGLPRGRGALKALVLDFDGVIADSSRESFSVALRTYRELRPESRLAEREPDSLYGPFLERMPLGNRAEDFGIVLAALESGTPIPDQTAYDAFRSRQDSVWQDRFHQRYYEVRRAWAESDPVGWRELMPPYREVIGMLRRHAGERQLAIATAKDRPSVLALLTEYGIADLFSEDRLVDKQAGRDKVTHLELLRERLDLKFSDVTFVDDKVNHLDSVAPLGVRCALAGWGYNGPREHALARSRGYQVLTLDDAESKLFDDKTPSG